MNSRRALGLFVAVAVVTAVLVVGVGAVLGGDAAPSGVAPPADPPGTWTGVDIATPPDETGTLTVDEAPSKTVVIDAAHANGFEKSEIQPLVDALVAAGHEVRFYEGGQFRSSARRLNQTLARADAFVVIDPGTSYSDSEIDGIEHFAEGGGRVLLVGEPRQTVSVTGLPSLPSTGSSTGGMSGLASALDVDVGSSYLYDMQNNLNNFQTVYASPTADGPLTAGVDRVALRRAVPVTAGPEATTVLRTPGTTRLASTREADRYGVLAVSGNVTAIGDASLFAPHRYRDAENEVLVGNVASFLVTGQKAAGLFGSEGGTGERPPRPPRPP